MKKMLMAMLLLIAITASLLSFAGCSANIPHSEAFSLIMTAIENGEKEPFYYYKETILKKDNAGKDIVDSLRVNLIGDIDNKYHAKRDENGLILNHKLNIVKSYYLSTKETIEHEFILGKSAENSKDKNKHNYLFYRELTSDDNYSKIVRKMELDGVETSIEDYISSNDYLEYRLMTKLEEIRNLKAEDFSVESITSYSKVTTIKITLSDKYLIDNPGSIFKNSTHAEIEITYDRISAITVLQKEKDPKTGIDSEKEPYKLYITYRGPNIKVPTLEKNSEGVYTW